ncbi:hypothetical protein AN1V17_25130 [Vallitalea sediminicola]
MRKAKKFIAVIFTLLVFSTSALAAPNLTVETNSNPQHDPLKYLEKMLKSKYISEEAYKLALEDYNYLVQINKDRVSVRSTQTTTYTGNLGDGFYHSNRSSTYENHMASVKVETLNTFFNGWDFNIDSQSVWFGTSAMPIGSVAEISNTVGTRITGVNVNGSLAGVSFSGMTSAGHSITNTNNDTSTARQTVDSHISSVCALNIYFESGSCVKIYDNSSKDSVSAIIKAIVAG